MRGTDPAVDLLDRLVSEGADVGASEVVRFELLAGVRDAELEALEEFFSALSWIPVDEPVTRTAGLLARKHRKAQGGIDDVDYLIAATALVVDAELLTTNVQHFPMFGDLRPAY